MAEQTFRSPGFFEREIDLSQQSEEVIGVPAGVIGTSEMGPAFVPVTIGSLSDFVNRFGELSKDLFAPYAVNEWFKNRTALTFMRVLGAGANDNSTDIEKTRTQGTVRNAGFKLVGTKAEDDDDRYKGVVQFIAARHTLTTNEAYGYPQYTNNISFNPTTESDVFLVRAMLMTATGTKFELLDFDRQYDGIGSGVAKIGRTEGDTYYKKFKLVLSSSANSRWNDGGYSGIRIFTASLNPDDDYYVGKILNTDPGRFQYEEHLLYGDFSVEDEIATLDVASEAGSVFPPAVALLSGSADTVSGGVSTDVFRNLFGRFDTRYSGAKTTKFISQPYGKTEFDLFHFETIADGQEMGTKYKVSITTLRKSSDPANPHGSFTVEVRAFDDSDTATQILEQYPQCTLDPNDDDFVARKIGDLKVVFDFDAEAKKERRFVVAGKYPNVSSRVRIVMSTAMNRGEVPKDALPFGFRGLPVLKTSDTLTDSSVTALAFDGKTYGGAGNSRMGIVYSPSGSAAGNYETFGAVSGLSGSILPPVPMRYKTTRGKTATSGFAGSPGNDELTDSRYYWGINTCRIPKTASLSLPALNPNASSEVSTLVSTYTKFLGISKLGTLTTGSANDVFCNNKFTLSKVALSANKQTEATTVLSTVMSYLTGTAKEHMLETVYIRNGVNLVDNGYTISDSSKNFRLTFSTLLSALTTSIYFNRFTDYTKFTNVMYGGFDGVNILDKDMAALNDRSTSTDTRGKANGTLDIGLSSDGTSIGATEAYPAGIGNYNNGIFSYNTAIEIMTDPFVTRINILAIPGIRDPYVTDHAALRIKEYSKAFYVMDLPNYDDDSNRIFLSDGNRPDVEKTREKFSSRAVNNNYSATYFPDVTIQDDVNDMKVTVPASIAVMAALGFNDSVSYPWFAPAGFNRAALSMVTNATTRLTKADRDDLYDDRINPIASFPNAGFVIFGQKTLQQAKSALDRVNVRRMLLEVKRLVVDVANKLLFEQNTPAMRARFVAQTTPLLALVQSNQGIEKFSVVCDESNNTNEDIENNKMNGRIVLVPTRAVEFIAIDFIITNAGVSFE